MVADPTSGPGRLQRQCARSVAEQLIEAAEHGFKTLRVKNPQAAAEAIHRDRFHLTEQDMPGPALEGAVHAERRQVVAGPRAAPRRDYDTGARIRGAVSNTPGRRDQIDLTLAGRRAHSRFLMPIFMPILA